MNPVTDPTTWPKNLLRWYRANRRSLPWRESPTPYAVWVSEVMLQQTQVSTVVPYYRRFLDRFPTVHALADANEQSVLKAWEGLGYYSRARHLHAGAKLVAGRFGGELPADVNLLKAIPGIGDYAAGAIASIAFGIPAPAVDGNVLRVLARLWAVRANVRQLATRRAITERLAPLIPPRSPGDFAQALMELGALVCRPQTPLCRNCPIRRHCRAVSLGWVERLPVREPSAPIPHRQRVALVLRNRDRFLVRVRRSGRLLKGLWEFPSVPLPPDQRPDRASRAAARRWGLTVRGWRAAGVHEHAFSHFKLVLHVWAGEVSALKNPESPTTGQWFTPEEIAAIPMPALHRRVATNIMP